MYLDYCVTHLPGLYHPLSNVALHLTIAFRMAPAPAGAFIGALAGELER
jgi:hypothetical protein